MAAGVSQLRGLQQHHEKEQGALRHDCRGGAKTSRQEKIVVKVWCKSPKYTEKCDDNLKLHGNGPNITVQFLLLCG